MDRTKLSYYIHGRLDRPVTKRTPGPYVTISREPGCEGYLVGDLLLAKLNENDKQKRWQLYKKEILKQLAQEADLTEEIIEQQRHAIPSLMKDFFRGMSKGGIPDVVRMSAYQGHVIIIGQGGTAATTDIPNGLSIRIEAPKRWRMIRVCRRDNISREEAMEKIEQEEQKRMQIRKIYEEKNPHSPAFNLVVDNSVLAADQIASLLYYTMQLKKMIPQQ
jgi:hypothetical protein